MSKKVKAHRKLEPAISSDDISTTTTSSNSDDGDPPLEKPASDALKPPLIYVYYRRRKRRPSPTTPSRENGVSESKVLKRRKIGTAELEKLGVDLNGVRNHLDGPRLRECRSQIGNSGTGNNSSNTKCGGGGASLENLPKLIPESRTAKKWVT